MMMIDPLVLVLLAGLVVVVIVVVASLKTRHVVHRTVSIAPPATAAAVAAALAAASPSRKAPMFSPASAVQWTLKGACVLVAIALAATHQLTPETAELLSAGFVSLGLTNAATIVGMGRILAAAAAAAGSLGEGALAAMHRANAAAGLTTTTTTTTAPSLAPPPMPPASQPEATTLPGDEPRDPFVPPGGALAGVVLAFALLTLTCAVAACGGASALSPEDGIAVGSEGEEQSQCARAHVGDRVATDDCRARVRAAWDAYWREHLDGGTEGGAR